MQLIGQLSEYSVAEIFQFVEQIYKNGSLLLQPEPNATPHQGKEHYLWFQEGRIMAVAEQMDGKGLLSMIKQRGWLNSQMLNILPEWSEAEQPLGLYLKAKGILTDEQLQVLFHAQAIQPVCAFFKLQDGRFVFDTRARLPKTEMTGLSLSASEASLLGLRVLRDWTALANKLPKPNCGLNKTDAGKPRLQLEAQERQVWEVANGKTSIEAIAKQLQLPVETVQQIAFRMKMAGLVEAVSITTAAPTTALMEESTSESAETANTGTSANPSLMKNLVNLLNTKIV